MARKKKYKVSIPDPASDRLLFSLADQYRPAPDPDGKVRPPRLLFDAPADPERKTKTVSVVFDEDSDWIKEELDWEGV